MKLKCVVLMSDSVHTVWFHFYAILDKAKVLMMENRSVVARVKDKEMAWLQAGNRNTFFKGMEGVVLYPNEVSGYMT